MSSHITPTELFIAICLRHGPAQNRVICRENCRDKLSQGRAGAPRLAKSYNKKTRGGMRKLVGKSARSPLLRMDTQAPRTLLPSVAGSSAVEDPPPRLLVGHRSPQAARAQPAVDEAPSPSHSPPFAWLTEELLWLVIRHLPSDDVFCVALTCCSCRNAARQAYPAGTTTTATALTLSVQRMHWGVSVKCPLLTRTRSSLCEVAARHGSVEILRWAHQAGYTFDSTTCAAASHGGHEDACAWLRCHGCTWDASSTTAAAAAGRVAMLRWLRDEGCPFTAAACTAAAGGGHCDALELLHQEGCPCNASACAAAAAGGHLAALRLLRAYGCQWSAATCQQAAEGGHLAVLEWASEAGCPLDALTCYAAACGGQLEVLQWLRARGCPWSALTCQGAAQGGHLLVLQWARRNGCPWDSGTFWLAVGSGNPAVLDWLRNSDCPR